MTKLTTHVLDIYSGKPGKGILVELFYLNDSEKNNEIARRRIGFATD